jgi:hypothetical protein
MLSIRECQFKLLSNDQLFSSLFDSLSEKYLERSQAVGSEGRSLVVCGVEIAGRAGFYELNDVVRVAELTYLHGFGFESSDVWVNVVAAKKVDELQGRLDVLYRECLLEYELSFF